MENMFLQGYDMVGLEFYAEQSQVISVNNCWMTGDRRKIVIREMSSSHIQNVIKCLEGKGKSNIPSIWFGKTKEKWLEIFNMELSKRS